MLCMHKLSTSQVQEEDTTADPSELLPIKVNTTGLERSNSVDGRLGWQLSPIILQSTGATAFLWRREKSHYIQCSEEQGIQEPSCL